VKLARHRLANFTASDSPGIAWRIFRKEIRSKAPSTPLVIPRWIMTNTVILSPAEVQTLGEEIAQLTKALAGCDPQVEARISIKSKPDKNLSKANQILEKIKQKWGF
jgi:hypothetical protein